MGKRVKIMMSTKINEIKIQKGEIILKKIVLLCAAGMSTSLLVTRMLDAAKKQELEYDIHAYSINSAKDSIVGADLVLLGPQVRYKLSEIKKLAGDIPVEVIDMVAYGMIDGEKIIKEIAKKL